MIISTKGRYALRILLDLAEHPAGEYIPMKEIAARQELSLKYLERIVPLLSRKGLVEGVHGKGGGYRLGVEPENCSLWQVLMLTEGDLAPVSCLECGAKPCERSASCKTLPVWKELDKRIREYLQSVSLADLLRSNPADHYVI
ncbi:MAG: Rrf2 family transcriptional regulator [Oscillospiraceae bacterium]|nr:Rrf2 family transcriptional regulator [Oscillospiraceae bacterium]